ncbi:MAG: hypothetical protein R2729_09340 [Bryobacteraceae bacterium]
MRQIAALLIAASLVAASQERTVSWDSLAAGYAGKTITVRDGAGKQWKGRVESVTGSGIVLIGRKGTQSVARASVKEIEYLRQKSPKWQLIGLAAGAGAGTAAIAFAEVYQRNETSNPKLRGGAIGLAIGAASLGFFAGRAADRERIVVRVGP